MVHIRHLSIDFDFFALQTFIGMYEIYVSTDISKQVFTIMCMDTIEIYWLLCTININLCWIILFWYMQMWLKTTVILITVHMWCFPHAMSIFLKETWKINRILFLGLLFWWHHTYLYSTSDGVLSLMTPIKILWILSKYSMDVFLFVNLMMFQLF